jgi:hypothetical protein
VELKETGCFKCGIILSSTSAGKIDLETKCPFERGFSISKAFNHDARRGIVSCSNHRDSTYCGLKSKRGEETQV